MTAAPDPSSPVVGDPVRRGRRLLVLLVLALLVLALVRAFAVQSYAIPSASMEPTLRPGDRIVVLRLGVAASVQRGDVVVFDGTTVFAGRSDRDAASGGIVGRVLGSLASLLSVDTGESDYVKRVIGLPGDHVVCCDQDGAMQVNGVTVSEPYLFPGDAASDVRFDVLVPPGRLWVMGDHRSESADSRAHLGDPGGGMVRVGDLVGRAMAVYWPPSRVQSVGTASQLSDIPAGRG